MNRNGRRTPTLLRGHDARQTGVIPAACRVAPLVRRPAIQPAVALLSEIDGNIQTAADSPSVPLGPQPLLTTSRATYRDLQEGDGVLHPQLARHSPEMDGDVASVYFTRQSLQA